MQIYLVGGSVRDQLLGLEVKDRDWLVVGATPAQLLAQGYQQVGKDFPVFLHPKTQEEYALARTERKSGKGYTGFICDFSPNISLEEDLIRRDLRINAMAQDQNGKIYDPYQGQQDLQQRLLRHVSPAFAEDPLRVLRVARFASRYANLGFQIAPETMALMQQIAQSGELSNLTPERIWKETEKALLSPQPQVYFTSLNQVEALTALFPELAQNLAQSLQYLQQACLFATEPEQQLALRFASLCYAMENKEQIRQFCQRLKVPTVLQELAELCHSFAPQLEQELSPSAWIELFNSLDIWRKPQRFQQFLQLCQAISPAPKFAQAQSKLAWQLYQMAQQVDVQQIIALGFQKQEIRQQLNLQRQQLIARYLAENHQP